MNWGLAHGLLGRTGALSPSSAAVGPNTYLAERDFLKMLVLALCIHALALGIYALIPNEKVTDIPVRALSFKLGNEDKVAAYAPVATVAAAPSVPAPVMQATNDTWRAAPTVPAPVVPQPLRAVPKPEPKPVPKPEPEVRKPRIVKVDEQIARYQPAEQYQQETPAPALAPAAVPVQPQQYVREVGAPTPQMVAAVVNAGTNAGAPDGTASGEGATSSMTQTTAQAIRARYELEISSWIQRHKYYPAAAGGREGRAVVRMRIDRAGNVRYYAIEQSAGMTALDDAALDMIRRANPVPAVPENYPAGSLVEFLIPITFKAP